VGDRILEKKSRCCQEEKRYSERSFGKWFRDSEISRLREGETGIQSFDSKNSPEKSVDRGTWIFFKVLKGKTGLADFGNGEFGGISERRYKIDLLPKVKGSTGWQEGKKLGGKEPRQEEVI